MKTENESNIKSQIERGKRMNLFYIRYFVELAKEQQYTKAAKNLNITQPSLSHAIHQLEEELGVLLFEKTGRNTVLTRYGEEFLVYAENTIRTLDQGIRLMQKGSTWRRCHKIRVCPTALVWTLFRDWLMIIGKGSG